MIKSAIIEVLKDAPEVWTAAELQAVQDATGQQVTREDLRNAHQIDESPTIQHARQAITESIAKARAAEFPERLRILADEIIPAAEFEAAQITRITTKGAKNNGKKK